MKLVFGDVESPFGKNSDAKVLEQWEWETRHPLVLSPRTAMPPSQDSDRAVGVPVAPVLLPVLPLSLLPVLESDTAASC